MSARFRTFEWKLYFFGKLDIGILFPTSYLKYTASLRPKALSQNVYCSWQVGWIHLFLHCDCCSDIVLWNHEVVQSDYMLIIISWIHRPSIFSLELIQFMPSSLVWWQDSEHLSENCTFLKTQNSISNELFKINCLLLT